MRALVFPLNTSPLDVGADFLINNQKLPADLPRINEGASIRGRMLAALFVTRRDRRSSLSDSLSDLLNK